MPCWEAWRRCAVCAPDRVRIRVIWRRLTARRSASPWMVSRSPNSARWLVVRCRRPSCSRDGVCFLGSMRNRCVPIWTVSWTRRCDHACASCAWHSGYEYGDPPRLARRPDGPARRTAHHGDSAGRAHRRPVGGDVGYRTRVEAGTSAASGIGFRCAAVRFGCCSRLRAGGRVAPAVGAQVRGAFV